jgi:glycosyltransferase involved in cell wall biosynthesis
MIGRNPGEVTTQGERLSDLFAGAGYPVITVSSRTNPYARAADIALTLLARRRAIDVAILQVFSGRSFAVTDVASRLMRGGRRRTVMALRGGNLPAFFARHPRWTRAVLARAHVLVAPSPYVQRAVRQLGFRCEIIPNLIDLPSYPYRQRLTVGPRLFWMRAFHDIYNPELAIRVLARVREACPEATLVMAGPDKGLKNRARELATRLGVSDVVRFAGFFEMPEKVREMAGADIFLNTNRLDNMPVSVLEACAMGLPVVATAVGGIPDLLADGRTGLLVPDDDEDAMSAAVLRLIQRPDLAAQVSGAGRSLAESCSADLILPRWQRLVDSVMSVAG